MSEMNLLVQAVAATLLLLGSSMVLWVVRSTDHAPQLRPAVATAKKRANYQTKHRAA